MTTVVVGDRPAELQDWLDRRRELGQDGYDEVWDGVYHVAAMAHGRQGRLQHELPFALRGRARAAGLIGSGPVNIGRPENFRVPDAVYLRTGETALWNPTAAIVVEIVSPDDESRLKFDFYFRAGVEEVLILDPQERTVEWYVRGGDGFVAAEGSALLGVAATRLHDEIDWPD